MFKPELLSPAGTLKNMRYAFAYGADAVYAGQPRYSLRVRNNEFKTGDVLETGIAEGKLERFFEDNVLLEQSFVKDASVSVKEMLSDAGVDVKRFVRYALGD